MVYIKLISSANQNDIIPEEIDLNIRPDLSQAHFYRTTKPMGKLWPPITSYTCSNLSCVSIASFTYRYLDGIWDHIWKLAFSKYDFSSSRSDLFYYTVQRTLIRPTTYLDARIIPWLIPRERPGDSSIIAHQDIKISCITYAYLNPLYLAYKLYISWPYVSASWWSLSDGLCMLRPYTIVACNVTLVI